MEQTDMDRFKEVWKGEQKVRMDEAEIKSFLHSSSKSIDTLFIRGVQVDLVMKVALALSFLVLVFIYREQQEVFIIALFLLLYSLLSIVYQRRVHLLVKKTIDNKGSIRDSLEAKIRFYNERYVKSLLVSATTSSLIFLSGMLFYFNAEYGKVRKFELDDFLVFGGAIVLAFVIGLAAQLYQHNFHIRQLKECLREIDEDTMNAQRLSRMKLARRRVIIFFGVLFVLGLLVFSYFQFR